MVVRGRKLVDQCHKRLMREGVYHGVLMNNHWNINPSANIQICSIDTLISRKIFPPADLIVYDEAHNAVSKGYREFVSHYPNAYHLAVTATPYTDQPLTHIAEHIVKPITMQDLINKGYLVPPIYYAPKTVDVSSVKISQSTKDYVVNDLEKIINENNIVGDLVETWRSFSEHRQTLVFAVSVKHSKHIAQMFNEAGIAAEHCDAETPEREREEVIKRFESGETKVITNVNLWSTGVDIPCVGCVVMARPTKSYTLFIQQLGRGTRPFPGKENFIVLDNAGNILRHGFITEEPGVYRDWETDRKSVV